MYKEIGKKGKLAVIICVFLLFTGLFSFSLVQGDKPPDAGEPPAGLLAEITERLNTLETDLNNLQNGIDELWTQMNQHVDGFNVAITNLQDDVANVWVELGEMNSRYQGQIDELWTQMNQHVDGFNVAITNLQNDIEGLGDSLDSAHTQISLIWGDIDTNIRPRMDSLQEQITEIHSLLAEVYTVMGNHVNDLQGQLDNVGIGLVNLQNQINGLQGQITTLNSDVNGLQNQINTLNTGLQNQINNLKTQINTLNSDVEGLQNQIDGLQGQIDSHDEDIDGLLNHVNTVDSHLQNQIDDLNVRTPQTGTIVIPAASFIPVDDTTGIINNGGYLQNWDATWKAICHAGLQLPDGATITEVGFYSFSSPVAGNFDRIMLYLYRQDIWLTPNEGTLIRSLESGTNGYGETSEPANEEIYSLPHYLTLVMPPTALGTYTFYFAWINYEYPT